MSLTVYLYNEVQGIRVGEFEKKYMFAANINNFIAATIAKEAGIFNVLWHPRRNGFQYGRQIIDLLQAGLDHMQKNPEVYYAIDEKHGWGLSSEFLKWVNEYIEACKKYPDCKIETF